MAIITINGKQYNDKKFTKTTKNILASLNFTNNEINKINLQISIYQTSKSAYSSSILKNLPEKQAAANRKNGIVTINDKKYLEEDISDKLKSDILVFKTINKKLEEFTIELAVLNTSKNVYSNALIQSLDKK
ncbi:hypothetical protein [Aliarcobacter cryaerophilus]|uniref:hypothetical protein n=1 Tax=Aliarcobacter cryaerophilus TaxID=28198 RepID=UPI0021B1DA64|nr:hypothetical protein [Aliarcobacter cryaerophilus]MCT7508728.1 hypothetical protein [Aliarcobacter cryaerophilus]